MITIAHAVAAAGNHNDTSDSITVITALRSQHSLVAFAASARTSERAQRVLRRIWRADINMVEYEIVTALTFAELLLLSLSYYASVEAPWTIVDADMYLITQP